MKPSYTIKTRFLNETESQNKHYTTVSTEYQAKQYAKRLSKADTNALYIVECETQTLTYYKGVTIWV